MADLFCSNYTAVELIRDSKALWCTSQIGRVSLLTAEAIRPMLSNMLEQVCPVKGSCLNLDQQRPSTQPCLGLRA